MVSFLSVIICLYNRTHIIYEDKLHLMTNQNEAGHIIYTIVVHYGGRVLSSVAFAGLHVKFRVFCKENTTSICDGYVKCRAVSHDGRKITT